MNIKKYALINKIKYGKVNPNSVIGKLIAEYPEIKQKIKEIIPEVQKICEEMNNLDIETAKKEILEILKEEGFLRERELEFVKNFKEIHLEKNKLTLKFEGFTVEIIKEERRKISVNPKEKEKEVLKYFEEVEIIEKKEEIKLPPLPKAVEGKVKTRFAPNPSGYLHIGHARAIILNYEYARMYKGKFVLRLEDTDPKVKKPVLDAYEKIKEDVEWLIQDKVDEFYIQSERLEIYYKIAKELIEKGFAYVCLCPQEKISELRKRGEACECRNREVEWHLEQWEKMLNGEYDEGQAVLRIKTDLDHPNPSVRDWIAFRIVNPKRNPHPWLVYKYGENYAEKFWVWPTYNFAAAVDDILMGITHILRMKEHEVNTEKQRYIYRYLNAEEPVVINYGAFIVKDLPLHKSEIKKLIEEGKITGWDDPFIPTLMGLRRRGIHPEAIKRYIIEVGPNPVDVVVSWEKIYKYNREIYDKKAKRLFFIEEPVEVIIESLEKEVKVKYHPEVDLGFRIFKVKEVVYIDKKDLDSRYLRLMEGFNIEILKVENGKAYAKYIDDSIETAKKLNAKIVQWIPKGFEKEMVLWKPEGKIKGLIEKYVDDIKENEVIHLVRVGFAKKERDYLIFMHR